MNPKHHDVKPKALTPQPKTVKGRRHLRKVAPKIVENNKSALFVQGRTANDECNHLLLELLGLHKPLGLKREFKDKEANPFVDPDPLETAIKRFDCSLFCTTTHSKKRPVNFVFGRTFDGSILDMIELGVDFSLGLNDIRSLQPQIGSKPIIVFQGDGWDNDSIFITCKSILLDFFRGPTVAQIAHASLRHCHVFFAFGDEHTQRRRIFMRSYYLCSRSELESNQKIQALYRATADGITIIPMGPNVDFTIRRVKKADPDAFDEALKRPVVTAPTKVSGIKNAFRDEIGRTMGVVYTSRQDLTKIATRRFKGLHEPKVPLRVGGDTRPDDSGSDD
ncbi:Brix domain containing protein [Giardia muris]|uniref:Ribosome production factor 2 homolog n=1 Tax=Giardia muris TaxID=5742 RepID=A0A4Z1T4B9_GIAMU|nr:Brix domain containing protein [Giardia muris]|eukprot:TNJ30508.1 Brix domain containing protein [Giardia muris]